MKTNTPKYERESADAEIVSAAVEALAKSDIRKAESLLVGVIANTPRDYANCEEDEESISIKFWDQAEFIHYVTWKQQQGLANKGINWIGNAYPRAHFYMGFICVKRRQFDRAIEFLDRGQTLEPSNPKFTLEKAQALVHSGRKKEALQLYDKVVEIGPHVSAHDLALARRGRGFVLIELGDLDGADTAFRSSLELEPNSEVALHELQYIHHLRKGGAPSFSQAVSTAGPNVSKCAACGSHFDKGVVVSVNGMPVGICSKCERKLSKKWWQFWK